MVCAGDQGQQGGDHADWAMSRKEGEQDSTVYFLGRRPYIGEGCTECLHNITQGTLTQQAFTPEMAKKRKKKTMFFFFLLGNSVNCEFFIFSQSFLDK